MPIIENTARECELTDRLQEAIKAYPKTSAVLVRRHGVYVWGRDWVQAKTQAECYDYLFEAAVRMSQMGIKASQAPAGLHAPQANGAANGIAHNGAGSGSLLLFPCYSGVEFVRDMMFGFLLQLLKARYACLQLRLWCGASCRAEEAESSQEGSASCNRA